MLEKPVRSVLSRLGLTRPARRLFLRLAADERTLSIDGSEARFVREDFGDQIELNQVQLESGVLSGLLAEVRPDDVFLDVGSNLGVYAVFVGRELSEGHVIAVEPIPATADKLSRNLELNSVHGTVANVAFADSAGSLTLAVPDAHGSSGISADGSGIEVASVRGDTYLSQNDLPQPTVVKVDVEGFESAVLRGLQSTLGRSECRLLYCEVHPDRLHEFGVSTEGVRQTMQDLGFEPTRAADLPGGRFILRGSKS